MARRRGRERISGARAQRRGDGAQHQGHAGATQREALERRWFRRLVDRPDLATLVTGESLSDEPLHRWFAYKQAFAPGLVRLFLREAAAQSTLPRSAASPGGRESRAAAAAPPARAPAPALLDPFAGSGTAAIECARAGVDAIGVEALPSLAFLASARSAAGVPDLPDLSGCEAPVDFAARLQEPIHRAALLCAVSRRHSSDGKPLADAPPLSRALADVVAMMRADLRSPLPMPVRVVPGDARELAGIADSTIGGILTSPPYLSRHDYTRITRPIEELFAFWDRPAARAGVQTPAPQDRQAAARRDAQVRAHPRAYARPWQSTPHPAVTESCAALQDAGERKLAGVTRSYFEDMTAALRQFARVLLPGGPCWIVIGGARLKDVYVPADLILAEMAADAGLDVLELRVARRLIPSGRKLGTLGDVAPRETLLLLRRRSCL